MSHLDDAHESVSADREEREAHLDATRKDESGDADAEIACSIMERARRAREQIEDGICLCADEPHLNLLHDLAVDLAVHGDCRQEEPGAHLEATREAFALGAAWALGDDDEAPAASARRAEEAEFHVEQLRDARERAERGVEAVEALVFPLADGGPMDDETLTVGEVRAALAQARGVEQ